MQQFCRFMPPPQALAERIARFHDCLQKGYRSQALEEIALAQQESPAEKGVAFFLTGLFFLEEGYAGRALKAMEEAVRLEPSSRECLYGLAMANSALGFYQEVLFCNKIGATTREIAHERGWGELLTPSLRAKDRLLFVTDEQVVLSLVEKYRRGGEPLKAASIAEDALLAFQQNQAWRRAAIVCNRAANRPFAAAALLPSFAAREALSVEDQLLTGEVFTEIGRIEESLSWFEPVANTDNSDRGCRAAVAKLLFFSRPPFSQRLLSLSKTITDGLPSVPRRKGTKVFVKDRLRIGIVSADLLLGGLVERVALLFEMFDKSNIEFFLYIDSPEQDALTERFMALSKDHFLTHAIDDATFARIVHEDEIDVLLDLDLRNIYRRPAVARLKPASLQVVAFADPQQAHRWGYDAVLSDPFLSPPPSTPSGTARGTRSGTPSGDYKLLDDTTPCPVLRPRFGFLQVTDQFDVQPIAASAVPRKKVRVGISASYAALDRVARDLLLRCLREVPDFELIVDSETLGGEKAAAALLAEIEKVMPHQEQHQEKHEEQHEEKHDEQHSRLQFLPEHSSLTLFLQQTDLLLDIAYPRSAYTVWQCLRHNVPVLTLEGTKEGASEAAREGISDEARETSSVAERLGLSVVAQMGLQDLCVCKNDDELLSRLRAFCSDEQHRRRLHQELQRRATLRQDPKLLMQQATQKALAVVEALFEGVVTLGRKGRYQPSSVGNKRQEQRQER